MQKQRVGRRKKFRSGNAYRKSKLWLSYPCHCLFSQEPRSSYTYLKTIDTWSRNCNPLTSVFFKRFSFWLFYAPFSWLISVIFLHFVYPFVHTQGKNEQQKYSVNKNKIYLMNSRKNIFHKDKLNSQKPELQ